MMNDDKLFIFFQNEFEAIATRSNTYGASTAPNDADSRSLEWVAKKISFLQNVLSCRTLTLKQITEKDIPFDHKKSALELFDQDTLIAQMLNGDDR